MCLLSLSAVVPLDPASKGGTQEIKNATVHVYSIGCPLHTVCSTTLVVRSLYVREFFSS